MKDLRTAVMMILYQASFAGVNLFYKLATKDGMKVSILIAYRSVFATAFLVPLALVMERKNKPKLTWIVVCQAFLTGLLGVSLSQNLYGQSLIFTSPTFVSAMTNLVPSITFILAIIFRMETLGLGTRAGKAKVIGTGICLSGAMLLTFYKGKELKIWSTHIDLLHKGQQNPSQHVAAHHGNHVLGAIMVLGCDLFTAAGFILQAKMTESYPCHYTATALMTFMGAIQAFIFALCKERSNWGEWKLKWDIRLLTVSYCGLVYSGAGFLVLAWCIKVKGPLYVTIFNPLMLVLVAIAGSLLLDEKLHVGSVVGAVVIVCGLYIVLWGKHKEKNSSAEQIQEENVIVQERPLPPGQ